MKQETGGTATEQLGNDARRASLRRRLDDGYGRIEAALENGEDVAAWETFWITLLREYEQLCDQPVAEAA